MNTIKKNNEGLCRGILILNTVKKYKALQKKMKLRENKD